MLVLFYYYKMIKEQFSKIVKSTIRTIQNSQTIIMQYPRMHTIVVHPINSIKHICCIVFSTSCKKLKCIYDIKSTLLENKKNHNKNHYLCMKVNPNLLRN